MGKWNSTGRSRDLFPGHGVNGKGDKNRTSDDKAYRQNYDEIRWEDRGAVVTTDDICIPATAEQTAADSLCPKCKGYYCGCPPASSAKNTLPAVPPVADCESDVAESGTEGPRGACV